MKLTKKRVAITVAAAALATIGIFGGTYAKYMTQTNVNTETARLAKFHLTSDNTIDLFKTEYDNGVTPDPVNWFGTDIKNDGSDTKNLIAPNMSTTKNLDFTVSTEVKSTLDFTGFSVNTNLPTALQDYINITLGTSTHTLAWWLANTSVGVVTRVADIPAGTAAGQYTVPVTVEWALDNNATEDAAETAAAIAQAEASADYFLELTGQAYLEQID